MGCVSTHCLTCFEFCALHVLYLRCVSLCLCLSPQFLSSVLNAQRMTESFCHLGQKTTRVHRSNVSLSAFSLDGLAVSVSNWKQVYLRRVTLIRHIMACRTLVEKGATRSIVTGTVNVDVGSSKTDMVAEKIESETCRPSTSMLRDERYGLVHSASRVEGPPRPRLRLRQRRSRLVQRPACFFFVSEIARKTKWLLRF